MLRTSQGLEPYQPAREGYQQSTGGRTTRRDRECVSGGVGGQGGRSNLPRLQVVGAGERFRGCCAPYPCHALSWSLQRRPGSLQGCPG